MLRQKIKALLKIFSMTIDRLALGKFSTLMTMRNVHQTAVLTILDLFALKRFC